jgi:hypothetical protein
MATDNTIKINIDIDDRPVKSLKAELRETVQQLQQTELGTEAFERLNAKAAALKDRMAEVNEQVAVFATGSKYEQVSNSLGEIGAGLRDMDFDRVTQGAKLFQKTAGAITFKDAIGSLKQMGAAFASIGKTILTNPLFLIVGVVAAIIAGIVALLDELGILKDIFKAVGDAIGFVIQKLKDFLDWMGLTSFAAEDSARRQAAAQEQIAAAHAAKQEKVVDAYDHEIRMAKIAGKDTVDMERQKQHAIIQTSRAQYEALGAQMEALRASGDLTKEKADEIRKAMLDLKENIREAKQEIQAINAQEVEDNKASNEKKAQDNAAAAKAAKEKRKQYAADRLAAERAIQDAEFDLLKEGEYKEFEANRIKYERLIQDTLANEKLLAKEREELVFNLKQQQLAGELAIEQKYLDQKAQAEKEANEKRLADEANKNEVSKAAAEEMAQLAKENAQKEIANRKEATEASIDMAGTLLTAISANVKEGSKAAKAVAVAQATIDTYKAAVSAYASAAQTPIVGPVLAPLAAAAAVAMGIANVRKILSTDPTKGSGTPSASGGGGSVPTPSFGMAQQPQQTPNMNINNGVTQNAGGQTMRERVIVVDYHDIQNKGNELQMTQQKVTLA